MSHRGYRYRLYPTADQADVLRAYAGASRFTYNLAVEQRRDWWRQYRAAEGRDISFASQSRELTQLRIENDWLGSAPRCVLDYALQDVERAFSAFYRGGGFPSFRSKDRHTSFRAKGIECPVRALNAKWAEVRLPKAAPIKFRSTRPITGKVLNVTFQFEAGAWYVTFLGDAESPGFCGGGVIGIDRGVANNITLSNGERASLPASIKAAIAARRRAQRILSRRKKGSVRRSAQRLLVAKHHARAAAARKHWLHEQSTALANRFRIVVLEDLKITNMTRRGAGKRGLNRSILEQGWAALAQMLEYKTAERGGQVHYVNPAYTSQTCSSCGSVNAESRKSQAVFECVDCGHRAHADVNAAINILRRSSAGVEDAGYSPVEAHTGEMPRHLENLAA